MRRVIRYTPPEESVTIRPRQHQVVQAVNVIQLPESEPKHRNSVFPWVVFAALAVAAIGLIVGAYI